jgi:CheY-like chemotaxis protein
LNNINKSDPPTEPTHSEADLQKADLQKKEQKENISLLANDINNQLSGIIGNAELLKQDGLGPYEKSQLIVNIVACAKQTTLLTDKIIALENNLPLPEKPSMKQSFSKSDLNTILVIDDEEVIRKVAKSILQKAGYEVILAANGKEGIESYKEQRREILCVLLDLTMPYMPGNLVYAKLKAIDPSVKVFLMTGLNMQQVMQQFESEQIAGFIKKPFLMEELLDYVKSAAQPAVH